MPCKMDFGKRMTIGYYSCMLMGVHLNSDKDLRLMA